MKLRYNQKGVVLSKIDLNHFSVPHKFSNQIKKDDIIKLEFISVKLCFYSNKDKEVTVIKTKNFRTRIFDCDWYQTGRYVIAKQ